MLNAPIRKSVNTSDAIDPRQATYLQAMGIDVWQRRAAYRNADPRRETTPAADWARPPVESMDWDVLRDTVLQCRRCPLHQTRTQAVFGVGDVNAEWLLVGEAPGAEEDRQGKPFVGRAGQLLNAMLLAIGCKREEVFIANILKCRPPKNRDPKPEEVACCEPYLKRQIELIQPKIVLALGRIAASNLLKTDTPIGRLRNIRHNYAALGVPVVVTYHPAYLLRSPKEKKKAWQDLLFAKSVYLESK